MWGQFYSWVKNNVEVIGAVSLGMVVFTVLLAGIVLLYLPADHFCHTKTEKIPDGWRYGAHIAWRILRNILGAVLLIAGIIMLILPGQGLLTILLAVILLEFPGKKRFQNYLSHQKNMRSLLNKLRARFGRPDFIFDD